MRQILRISKKRSDQGLPSQVTQKESISSPQTDHPEPVGHVDDRYRHWVWLDLHQR